MSLYDVSDWTNGTQYYKHNVVWGGTALPYYLYALEDHVSSGGDITTDFNAGKWDGITWVGGNTYAKFLWSPSFGLNVQVEPKVKVIKFGDGYEQRIPDGVNTSLIVMDYSFENRDLNETTAILHFFETRGAHEAFIFTPLPPYDKQKTFVCRSWDHVQNFINNYSIKAKFEEIVA